MSVQFTEICKKSYHYTLLEKLGQGTEVIIKFENKLFGVLLNKMSLNPFKKRLAKVTKYEKRNVRKLPFAKDDVQDISKESHAEILYF